MKTPLSDLTSISQLSRKMIENLIETARYLKISPEPNLLSGKVIASLFFEASTRTRLSFETAVYRLGGQVIGFSDSQSTSFKQKGESLEDTIKMLDGYADLIIMRHPEVGSAKIAADTAKIPVINAGDGANEHPTQTLTDLMSIFESQQTIDGLTIGLCGDLKYGRTIHSLVYALCLFKDITFILFEEKGFELPKELLDKIKNQNFIIKKAENFESEVKNLDVLYMTRVQKERFSHDETNKNLDLKFKIDRALIEKYAKDNLSILHPLPRLKEINPNVDQLKQAQYFNQAKNGVFIRQALLKLMLMDKI